MRRRTFPCKLQALKLEAHIKRFLEQKWPTRVLQGLALFYESMANATEWFMTSGPWKQLPQKETIQEINDLFVSQPLFCHLVL